MLSRAVRALSKRTLSKRALSTGASSGLASSPGSEARLQALVDSFRRDVESYIPQDGKGAAFATGEPAPWVAARGRVIIACK